MKIHPNNRILLLFSIFILFILIPHRSWLLTNGHITSGDWFFWHKETLKNLQWNTWFPFFNFGQANVQIYFLPFKLIWKSVAQLGGNYTNATQMSFFIPMLIVGFWGTLLFLNKFITNNITSNIIGAIFYNTTTYFLVKQTGHLPIAFVYSMTPLILFLSYKVIIDFEKNKDNKALLNDTILFILIVSLAISYELRIVFEVLVFILPIFILLEMKGNHLLLRFVEHIPVLALSALIAAFINAYWLLPSIHISKNIESITHRPLFGNFLYSIFYALTIFESSWTGSRPNQNFIPQHIKLIFWLIPLLGFLVFILKIDKKHYSKIGFFSLTSLLGIFLTTQSNLPLPHTYDWLYNHMPGFSLFRTASKFYLLTSLGYLGLISYTIFLFSRKALRTKLIRKSKFYIFYSLLLAVPLIISVLNIKPLLTGEIKTTFIGRKTPDDYVRLKAKILDNEQYNFFRTLWVPAYSRWGFYSPTHPMIHTVEMLSRDWQQYLPSDNRLNTVDRINYFLSQPFANQLLDVSSIKYVAVPIQDIANDDDFFKYYGPREEFVKIVESVPYLQKIDIGTKELLVFENKDFRPHIYTTLEQETIYKNIFYQQVQFKYLDPTQYRINLTNISQSVYLNFSESFHPEWKIRVGEFKWYKAFKKDYFIDDKYHFKNDAGLNSFYIDPQAICQKFSCSQNPDNSYNLKLTLYFKSQSYMNLGLIISGTTLVLVLGYLGYSFVSERRNKIKGTA